MSLTNAGNNEVHCKIVYYGAHQCGKTSNIAGVCERTPALARGEMLTLDVQSGQAVSYEFLPLDMGTVRGRKVRFHLYSVPGDTVDERTQQLLMDGAYGIVFVVDSQKSRFRENVLSYEALERIQAALGKPPGATPLVLQYNKRDLPDAMPVAVLNARLNGSMAPYVLAVAIKGMGVVSTLRAVSEQVLARL